MKKSRWYRRLIPAGICAFLIFFSAGVVLWNQPPSWKYPVRGVDVSSYQGLIDWDVLASQGIDFAFIKATEGSSFTDPRFVDNIRDAQQTGLRIGAYHFFSYDSGGRTQAANYIAAVERFDRMLPPVVDVEFYGDKERHPPDKAAVRAELQEMLHLLEEHYGLRPILYSTGKAYRLYLADDFAGYDIWIRDILTTPHLPDGRSWTFWQYTDRARLKGYHGKEDHIDVNVFHGSREEFEKYAVRPDIS